MGLFAGHHSVIFLPSQVIEPTLYVPLSQKQVVSLLPSQAKARRGKLKSYAVLIIVSFCMQVEFLSTWQIEDIGFKIHEVYEERLLPLLQFQFVL